MADPIGENSYKGLAVPLYGESQIQQQNSSNAVLTLMHSSDNAGRFLLGRDMASSADAISEYTSIISGNNAQFEIDADGYYTKLSGSTQVLEFNTSGLTYNVNASTLYEWKIDSSGVFNGLKRTVTELTSASTATAMQTSLSGSIFWSPTPSSANEDHLLSLPASSLAPVGTEFDVVIEPTTASTATIVSATNGSSDRIFLAGMGASTVSTAVAVCPISTGGASGKFVLVSTNQWQIFPYGSLVTSDVTTDFGSTVMVHGWTTVAAQ